MKTDDLSKVKHIGAVRMKRFNDSGITTIDQLCETPLDKLARIDTIGSHYARLIKEAAMVYCGPTKKKVPTATAVDKQPKTSKVDQNFQKQVKLLRRRIKQTNEKLKPLGNKKYLALYVDCKKRSKRLITDLKEIIRSKEKLPKKVKKNLTRKAEALNIELKRTGKKPKKKTYNQVSKKLKAFTELLENSRP